MGVGSGIGRGKDGRVEGYLGWGWVVNTGRRIFGLEGARVGLGGIFRVGKSGGQWFSAVGESGLGTGDNGDVEGYLRRGLAMD